MENFLRQNEVILNFFNSLPFKVSKENLYFSIEQLLKVQQLPETPPKDFSFYSSRFFKDLAEFLNFFKTEKGEWISAKGFFVGFSYALFFICGQEKFIENKSIMFMEEIPFDNFSPEENGLYAMYSIKIPGKEFRPSDFVQIFATDRGHQCLFIALKKSVVDFTKELYHFINTYDDYHFLPVVEINVENSQIADLIKFLEEIKEFNEILSLGKLFEYCDVFTLANDNKIRQNIVFECISEGLLKKLKNEGMKITIIVLHILNPPDRIDGMGDQLLVPIERENPFFFVNNIPTFNPDEISSKPLKFDEEGIIREASGEKDINVGYFLKFPARGSATGLDYSCWIGSFLFGISFYQPGRASEIENFIALSEFCKKYSELIELKTYVINREINFQLFMDMLDGSPLRLRHISEFALFFSSDKEISQMIDFNNYRASYQRFLNSFNEKGTSNKEKQDALEMLSANMFSMIPGVKVSGMDVRTEAEEIDLVITLNGPLFGVFDFLGPIFLVECRNLKKKVNAEQIRDFAGKLKSKNLRGGIIISRLGITGRTLDEGARRIIRDYAVQGKTIIALDNKDLEEISNGKDPLTILKHAYLRLYFKI